MVFGPTIVSFVIARREDGKARSTDDEDVEEEEEGTMARPLMMDDEMSSWFDVRSPPSESRSVGHFSKRSRSDFNAKISISLALSGRSLALRPRRRSARRRPP